MKGLKVEVNHFYRVQLVPELECVRLLGLFFDTNKTFILPGTLELLKLVPKQYKRHPDGEWWYSDTPTQLANLRSTTR